MHFKEYDYLFLIALFADLVLLACLVMYYYHPAYNFFILALVAGLYIPVQFGCLILLFRYRQEAKEKAREQFIQEISAQYSQEIMEEIQAEKEKIARAHASLIKDLETENPKSVRYASQLRPRYCHSLLLNALFSHKMALAHREDIDFSLDVLIDQIPENQESTLISLFANLIDNAFAAAKKAERPYVRLEAYVVKSVLMIHLCNSIDSGHKVDLSKSSKKDPWKHGFGLKAVQEILRENEGRLRYYQKKNLFCQDISLSLRPSRTHTDTSWQKIFTDEKGKKEC